MRARAWEGAAVGLVVVLLAGCGEEVEDEQDAPIVVDASFPTTFEEGLALGIVYDTSGSMGEQVAKAEGGRAPKYQIGNVALMTVARRLAEWEKAAPAGTKRNLETGLVVFEGDRAKVALPLQRSATPLLEDWARRFRSPDGSTPLGRALEAAGVAVLRSRLSRKHVLVITDGESNRGIEPADALGQLRAVAARTGAEILVHFVAFDVNAQVFAPVKTAGATLVSAADGGELAEKLSFILEEEILLEK